MKDSDINKEILYFHEKYKTHKDGGVSFVKEISKEINNSVNRKEFIFFLLKEIRNNKFEFCDFSFFIIEEIGDKTLGKKLFKIYNEVHTEKNERWEQMMFELLFKMQFKAPKIIYRNYINEFIKKNKEHSFFTLVLFIYSNAYPELSINYLSDFLVYYFKKNEETRNNISNMMYFLFSWFSKNKIDYLPQLLKLTIKKDNKMGKMLIEFLINYIKSDLAKYKYKDSYLKERKDLLESLLV